MELSTKNKTAYWVLTLLFLLPTAGGGVPEALGLEPASIAATMAHLGYPAYLTRILGVAKVLGALAILSGRRRGLKEWAYAGFAFDFLGAAASHAFVGDRGPAFVPLVFLALMAGSYLSWHRIDDASPARAEARS